MEAESHPAPMKSRYRGSLLGLAAGDALGTTLEFKAPGSFEPIKDIVGGGPFALKPGEWTDDTSLALCLAESLIERRGFDPLDQLQRYVRWMDEGHLSSQGRCFDIGGTTRKALSRFKNGGGREYDCGSKDPGTAGNGSLMRLAPVPLAFARKPRSAIEKSGESSLTTHGASEAVDACRYMGSLIVGALNGVDKESLLLYRYEPLPGIWKRGPLCPTIDAVAAGSFKDRRPPVIRGLGHVVMSLEAALWAFQNSGSFEEGALLAVNLGDDADTTGAVYGQLAGAFYGEEGIPAAWRDKLARRGLITDFADGLFALAGEIGSK